MIVDYLTLRRSYLTVFSLLVILSGCEIKDSHQDMMDLSLLRIRVLQGVKFNNRLVEKVHYDTVVISYQNRQDSFPLYKVNINPDSKKYEVRSIPWIKQGDSTRVSRIRKQLLDYMDLIEDLMIDSSGGVNENGIYINPQDKRPTRLFFLEEGEWNHLGVRLEESLRAYRIILGGTSESLVLEPRDHAIFKYNPYFKGMAFKELYFQDLTLVEALERLNFIKLDILQLEREFYLRGDKIP